MEARLPTFLCIGAQKAGTTSLHRYLSDHPGVFVTAEKELNFFCEPGYQRGIDWYAAQFEYAPADIPRGELSPFYTSFPSNEGVPARVAKHVPDVRLIYVVREPIARMVSHYRHQVALERENRPLDVAVFDDWWTYIARSCYAMQIEQWLEYFDRSALLVVTSEDLRDDPLSTLRTICDHIGAASPGDVNVQQANARGDLRREGRLVKTVRATSIRRVLHAAVPSGVRRRVWRMTSRPLPTDVQTASVSPDVRRRLVDDLTPDLEKLRSYLGGDFHCWGLLDDQLTTN
jgi:hypothetical protein